MENINNWFLILFICLIVGWIVLECYILYEKTQRNVRLHLLSAITIVISFILTIVLSVISLVHLFDPIYEGIQLIGLFFIFIGLVFRYLIYHSTFLKFADNVRFERKGFATVIEGKGWYKYSRHPHYIGLLLISWGIGLTFGNYISFLYAFLFMTCSLLLRVYTIEKGRENIYGESYQRYRQKTKLIFPYIL